MVPLSRKLPFLGGCCCLLLCVNTENVAPGSTPRRSPRPSPRKLKERSALVTPLRPVPHTPSKVAQSCPRPMSSLYHPLDAVTPGGPGRQGRVTDASVCIGLQQGTSRVPWHGLDTCRTAVQPHPNPVPPTTNSLPGLKSLPARHLAYGKITAFFHCFSQSSGRPAPFSFAFLSMVQNAPKLLRTKLGAVRASSFTRRLSSSFNPARFSGCIRLQCLIFA